MKTVEQTVRDISNAPLFLRDIRGLGLNLFDAQNFRIGSFRSVDEASAWCAENGYRMQFTDGQGKVQWGGKRA